VIANNDTPRRLRRNLLTAMGGLLLGGCDALSRTEWFPKILRAGEVLSRRVQYAVTPRKSMAQEFTEGDLSPSVPSPAKSSGATSPAPCTRYPLPSKKRTMLDSTRSSPPPILRLSR